MLTCINKNAVEYQTLKNRSGISDFVLESVCRDFMQKYNRFPHLDELPNSNSEPHLRDSLELNKYNSTQIDNILQVTGSPDISSSIPVLNDQYRDLEIDITPIQEEAIVDIVHRPVSNNLNSSQVIIDPNMDNLLTFDKVIRKLDRLYGIKFNEITDSELNSNYWKERISDPSSVNAFIYNNQVYINVDKSSVDAPIHELSHILIGSMRFQNPVLYQNLINLSESLPDYQIMMNKFQGRSRNDINEEILVTETAKYLTGQKSSISSLNKEIQYEISYNIHRVLDSILMGQDSVKTISNDRLFNMSLKQLAKEVNSTELNNNFFGTINVKGAELHRVLNNMKSDLIKEGTLKEYCE